MIGIYILLGIIGVVMSYVGYQVYYLIKMTEYPKTVKKSENK